MNVGEQFERGIPGEVDNTKFPAPTGDVVGENVYAELGCMIGAATVAREVADAVLHAAYQLFGWDSAFIDAFAADGDSLFPLVLYDTIEGSHVEVSPGRLECPVSPVAELVCAQGAQMFLRTLPETPAPGEPDHLNYGVISRKSLSLLFVPIRSIHDGRCLGVFSIQSHTAAAYDKQTLEAFQRLADCSAGALERTVTDNRIRQSESILRSVYDGAELFMGVLEVLEDDVLHITANAATSRFLGLPKEQLRQRLLSQMGATSKELALGLANCRACIQRNVPVTYETIVRRIPGGPRRISVTLSPISRADSPGARQRISYIAQDITERRRTEQALKDSEARFQAFMDNSPAIAFMKNDQGVYVYANTALKEKLGDPTGLKDSEWVSASSADEFRSQDHQVITEGIQIQTIQEVPDKSGGPTYWLTIKFPFRDSFGHMMVGGVGTDVSDMRNAERKLLDANDSLKNLVAELWDRHKELTRLNEMGEQLQAAQNADESITILRSAMKDLFPSDSGALYLEDEHTAGNLRSVASWGDQYAIFPLELSASEALMPGIMSLPFILPGEGRGILALQPTTSDGDDSSHFPDIKSQILISVAEQISMTLANLRLRESLRRQSIRDSLTDLYNRRFLMDSLERELQRSGRHGRPLGLLMLDLDHFKQLNDAYGHEAGDVILRALGDTLRSGVRGEDMVCRYGGEEFAIIMPESNLDSCITRAEQLRLAIGEIQVEFQGALLPPITASVGVAVYPVHGGTPRSMLRAADMALYKAKAAGRNRVVSA